MEPQSRDIKVPQLQYETSDSYEGKAQYDTLDVDALESIQNVDSEENDLTIELMPDAKIWKPYLEEAERQAKERAELWRTGLDSPLIFAGLFACLVAGFVIDAKSDLQSDSQQRLLSEILGALQDPPSIPTVEISESSQWVSGLWVVSLALVVFSAIGDVLAKAWLAKYVPIITQREANFKDALARYQLDRQAEKWHLQEVLTAVPLLVQVALFLFLVGLMIQTNRDNQTIGSALAAFCTAGGLVYFTMTVLPLWNPASPFDTPLSSLFLRLKIPVVAGNLSRDDSSSVMLTKGVTGTGLDDDDEVLAAIFYRKLLKSPKSTYVDEAARKRQSKPPKRKRQPDNYIQFLPLLGVSNSKQRPLRPASESSLINELKARYKGESEEVRDTTHATVHSLSYETAIDHVAVPIGFLSDNPCRSPMPSRDSISATISALSSPSFTAFDRGKDKETGVL